MNTYTKVVEAADALDRNDTQGVWRLADAILAHVPAEDPGRKPDNEGTRVPSLLESLAHDLEADGIRATSGDPYRVSTLSKMRAVAAAYPEGERFPEAAYRTHQEARTTVTGKRVLRELCKFARGETCRRPHDVGADGGLIVSAAAWDEAKLRIQNRTSGYAVAANDIRVALSRKTNVPTPDSETLDALKDKLKDAADELGEDVVADAIHEASESLSDKVYDDERDRRIDELPDVPASDLPPSNPGRTDELLRSSVDNVRSAASTVDDLYRKEFGDDAPIPEWLDLACEPNGSLSEAIEFLVNVRMAVMARTEVSA